MSDLSDAERERVREAVHERWQEIRATDLTSRQTEQRRLAAEMRSVIDRLVATQAPEEALRYAADALARLAVEFDIYPRGTTYEGFAEAANAGGDPAALFDHSPLIGKANPLAPPIEIDIEDDKVIGRVTFGAAYEGPPGCVHGGYLAATFDEVLGGGPVPRRPAGDDRHADGPLPLADAPAHPAALRGRVGAGRGPQELHDRPLLRRRPA